MTHQLIAFLIPAAILVAGIIWLVRDACGGIED